MITSALNQRTTKISSGFTVIELLVYLAIFTAVSVASISLLLSLQELYGQYLVKQDLLLTGSGIMERVLLEVREGSGVNIGESAFATSTAGVLAIETFEQGSGTSTTYIEYDSGTVSVRDTAGVVSLMRPGSVVDGLTFYHYEANGIDLVRIAVTVTASRGSYTESMTLQGAAIIRGSYVSS